MGILTIPDKAITLTENPEIRAYLNARGILFEQWEASCAFSPDATPETIMAAYEPVLTPYKAAHGYQTADVISVRPDTPNLPDIRAKFLREHTHTEDEVRFFVDGQGFFWFNLENDEPVFCVKCVSGDLLSVPANVKHWFDLGPEAFVKTIRIFTDAAGWVPHYTQSGVDERFREGF
ncbi:acireductone dioxygenase [Vampirovibrio sp.]|uniref:1,2-dihydroxy-3-keto-5-methylthiopentene dioxygenase n=1 Tax=Vampirovibrio sp. TaxID=2717857 RepID=UPI003593AB70